MNIKQLKRDINLEINKVIDKIVEEDEQFPEDLLTHNSASLYIKKSHTKN